MLANRLSDESSLRSAIGGYDAVFQPELDKKYMCPICLVALKDAVQTSCGHRFCEMCVDELSRNFTGLLIRCPVDNKWFNWTEELFVDNAMRREIMSLNVLCNSHTNGCKWNGELRDLEDHVQNCEFTSITCKYGCLDIVLNRDKDDHEKTCSHRDVPCGHCGKSVKYMDLTRHEVLECEMFPVRCTLCGQWGIKRQDIQQHIDKESGDCPKGTINCRYQRYGCEFQDQRQNMQNHEEKAAGRHLTYVNSRVTLQDMQITKLRQEIHDLSSKLLDRTCQLETVLREVSLSQSTNFNGCLQYKTQYNPDQTFFPSKPFFTGVPGYKLFVSTEFSAESSHVAIGVHLQQGQFDDEILFPFNATCTVSLLAQSPTASMYTKYIKLKDMARCGINGQPLSTQKVLHKFIPVDRLKSTDYSKNGAFFMNIQVNVSFKGESTLPAGTC